MAIACGDILGCGVTRPRNSATFSSADAAADENVPGTVGRIIFNRGRAAVAIDLFVIHLYTRGASPANPRSVASSSALNVQRPGHSRWKISSRRSWLPPDYLKLGVSECPV